MILIIKTFIMNKMDSISISENIPGHINYSEISQGQIVPLKSSERIAEKSEGGFWPIAFTLACILVTFDNPVSRRF